MVGVRASEHLIKAGGLRGTGEEPEGLLVEEVGCQGAERVNGSWFMAFGKKGDKGLMNSKAGKKNTEGAGGSEKLKDAEGYRDVVEGIEELRTEAHQSEIKWDELLMSFGGLLGSILPKEVDEQPSGTQPEGRTGEPSPLDTHASENRGAFFNRSRSEGAAKQVHIRGFSALQLLGSRAGN
mmetsp:Transcript_49139/g.76647  ORF Transcript_49139/g.76647 Transcript_49139/m.76647 type:complete len:181 (-) Transcript_49139:1247-1789(-)